ncbi:MAG: hypothetical protein FJ241_10630 [Nitrospira sp.]|nr:hypothetical protein [Nitrospira sp.]
MNEKLKKAIKRVKDMLKFKDDIIIPISSNPEDLKDREALQTLISFAETSDKPDEPPKERTL